MSLQTVNTVLSSINTTLYRNWIKAFSDAFTALGIAKTSDTGQVSLTPTTLALPTAGQGLAQGTAVFNAYEIRQMVSSGKPTIFLKIRYGVYYNSSGTGANFYWPCMSIEFGTATNGAGQITPVDGATPLAICTGPNMSGSNGAAGSGRPATAASNSYVASDGANYLTIAMGVTALSSETKLLGLMGMERTNTPGAATFAFNGNGFAAWSAMAGPSDNTQAVSGAASPSISFTVFGLADLNLGAQFTGGSIPGQTPSYVYRPNPTDLSIYPVTVGIGHGPLLTVAGVDLGVVGDVTQYTASMYGQNHTYVVLLRTDRNADPFNLTNFAIMID